VFTNVTGVDGIHRHQQHVDAADGGGARRVRNIASGFLRARTLFELVCEGCDLDCEMRAEDREGGGRRRRSQNDIRVLL